MLCGPMRHIIAILLQNEAGALTRVTGLISTRGYNIESLSVAPTNDPTVSRLTLVTTGSDEVIAQINAQLLKLVDVVAVEDMTSGDHLARELLLIKLQIAAEHIDAVAALIRRVGGKEVADLYLGHGRFEMVEVIYLEDAMQGEAVVWAEEEANEIILV